MQRLSDSGDPLDPVRLEVYRALLQAVAEEMGAALRRTAYSPNIKERRDYSCAVCDDRATPVALGDHMPVHLGAMPRSVEAALRSGPIADGDVVVLNDPYHGGTHLPDITAVRGVWVEGVPEPLAYVAARAHHADVGGVAPGSMPLSREIYQEGLRLPPVHLVRRGAIQRDVWRVILTNVRTPDERAGDLHAQLAALDVGVRRLAEIAGRSDAAQLRDAFGALDAYADRLVRAVVSRIPDGVYTAEDYLDDDGAGTEDVRIAASITVRGATLTVDFSGSAPQCPGNVNAVSAITESAVRYVLRCVADAVLGARLPAGGGAMASVTLIMPPGSVVDAQPPAAVAAGNVETSQRIVDVVFRALAQALPELIPACSSGTMNNLTLGGVAPDGRPFAYYETVAGGMGAGPQGDGLSGVHTHMTNSLNTPIEALEHALPIRVRHYSLRRGSGGGGRRHGGDGLRRDIELRVPTSLSILSDRRRRAPCGAGGGEPGARGANRIRRSGGEPVELPGKTRLEVEAGDVISILTPGGGGWGEAER